MITRERLIELLRDLPAVHLDLLDLVWKLTGDDGSIDPEKIAFHYTELQKVIGEAECYARATKEMVQCLTNLLH